MNSIGGKSNTGEGGEESRALPRAARRALQALGDQAGRLRPLRRDDGVPRQLRHDADQDRARGEARRGRAASRPQGRRQDRPRAPLDARRRPDLAAAAPRHLLDRGSGAAHLRPEERQPGGRRLGEARLRGRRRHGRGRRRQGARRPHHDLRLRGRHGRLAAHLDQARRLALGDRPRRDAADAGAEPPARARRAPGRRRPAHRAATSSIAALARRRRVRLLDRAADRGRLHHDAQVPPQHLPGRRRDAGPGAAQALQGPAGARGQLLLLRRRGGARADGARWASARSTR